MTVPERLKFSVKRWAGFILFCWTAANLFFAWYNFHLIDDFTLAQVHTRAREAFNKDQSFRLWATKHGGVFVPSTADTPPNAYLKVPERDIVAPSGTKLTLMNPAYMVRQLNELFGELYGVKGHITSLRPLRPENGPDAWEEKALRRFNSGDDEVYEIVDESGSLYARLMRPMPVTPGCLKCHGHQGYQIGDIRGGVSVRVPLAPFLPAGRTQKIKTGAILSTLWLAGAGIILLGSTLLSRNLRERDLLAERLKEAKKAAEQANSAKSVFLANMSHEIRTPLNGILGMLQLMKRTDLDEEQSEYANAAIESGDRLTHLLSDILDLSMAETGVIELRKEPMEMSTVFAQMEQLFRVNSQQTGVEMVFTVSPDIPPKILGDAVRLQQILANLVGNAIKFTKTGTIRVEAHPLFTESGQFRTLISVSDTGNGISDGHLKKIFEPFAQAEEGYNRSYQGAGLGLAICKRLTALMGGSMSVSSREGIGTTVYLSLPFQKAELSGDGQFDAGQSDAFLSLNLRILLAEDDPINRLMAERLMAKMGCTVTAVGNGRQALEQLRQAHFDLVIMDIQMPVMDGLEAVKAIRKGQAGADNASIPVVAMTAYANREDARQFMASGMDGYLPKPIDIDRLYRELRRHAPASRKH